MEAILRLLAKAREHERRQAGHARRVGPRKLTEDEKDYLKRKVEEEYGGALKMCESVRDPALPKRVKTSKEGPTAEELDLMETLRKLKTTRG